MPKMKVDLMKSGVMANVMTGAGYLYQTSAADIAREMKGDSFQAKQGIVYKTKDGVLKAKNYDTNVNWKPATVDGKENSRTGLVTAIGTLFFFGATLAF